jgi:hypothetical protein
MARLYAREPSAGKELCRELDTLSDGTTIDACAPMS